MSAPIDLQAIKDFVAQSGIEVVVDWRCPECNAENSDLPDETSVPLCGNCNTDIDWGDIFAAPVTTIQKPRGSHADQTLQLRRP